MWRVDRNVGGTDGKGVAKKIKTRQELKTTYTCKHGNMDNQIGEGFVNMTQGSCIRRIFSV